MPEKMIETLVDRAPLAIVIIGVFVFIIGGAGGLPVGNPPLQIVDATWRIGLGILGILLATAGMLLQFREATKRVLGSVDDAGGSITAERQKYQVHRYSGTWIVQNSFSRWRDRKIVEPDKVSFDGKTLLVIPFNGEGGVGVQIGRLQVSIDNYHAIYEIVNEVQSASVDNYGTLRMQVEVIRRQLVEENPPAPDLKDTNATDPYADLRGDLKNRNFPLVLKPVAERPLQLGGSHYHEENLSKDQIASEKYVHTGLFGPPGLR